MTYRPEIDGLRAIAVLAVIFAHAGFDALKGGFIGVDVFFVLSGYLIGSIILRDLEGGTFSFRHFYARRARRILPALIVVLIAAWLPAWLLMTHSEMLDFAPSVLASLLFVSNVYFWDLTGYFSPASETLPLLHTWSLSIEEQYYLLFPLIGFVTFKLLGRTAFFLMAFSLAALSLALAEWGVANKPDVNYFFTFSRVWEILAGTLCVWAEKRWSPKGIDAFGLAGLGAIAASILIYDATIPFPSLYALLPVVGTMAVLLFARAGTLCAKALSLRGMTAIGLVSYSAYLWHQPVFAYARIGGLGTTDGWIAIPLIGLILGLSWASWRFVEVPFRKGRSGIFANLPAAAIAFCTTGGLAGLSVLVYTTDVSITRYAVQDRPLIETTRRDALSYMRARSKSMLNAPFANDGRTKVFIVGDSFGRDFINILGENDHLDHLDISFHIISWHCGNVFITPQMDFPKKPLPSRCNDVARYEDDFVLRRLADADVVLLISRWRTEFIEFLPESLVEIKKYATGPVLVLGTKAFGSGDPHAYLDTAPRDRPALSVPVQSESIAVNTHMAALDLPGFIDVQRILCGDAGALCPIVATDGRMISVDEGHLTASGARDMGRRLIDGAPDLRRALDID